MQHLKTLQKLKPVLYLLTKTSSWICHPYAHARPRWHDETGVVPNCLSAGALQRLTEADPQRACLKSVCLSATRQQPDGLVSGQGLSWSGALTGFSATGTGYCSHTHTKREGKVECVESETEGKRTGCWGGEGWRRNVYVKREKSFRTWRSEAVVCAPPSRLIVCSRFSTGKKGQIIN